MLQRLKQLNDHAHECGLVITGVTSLTYQDGFDDSFKSIALLSPDQKNFWALFSTSVQAKDGLPDPIDRWSRKAIGNIASKVEGLAVFPFEGPPYHPFSSWAQRAGVAWQSPSGLLVHAEYGLWISFRGAIALEISNNAPSDTTSPCVTCLRPCLQACPVNALGSGTFDYQSCLGYVRTEEGKNCTNFGCLARRACPIGQHLAPPPQQISAHMTSFAGGSGD